MKINKVSKYMLYYVNWYLVYSLHTVNEAKSLNNNIYIPY